MFVKGQTPLFNKKNGVMTICANCGKEKYRRKSQSIGRKFCSHKCFGAWNSKNRIANNSPRWQGGLSPLRERIRALEENKKWKFAVLHRDNYTCQKCYAIGDLHAHHKIPFNIILKEFLGQYNQFSPIEDKETLVRIAINYAPFWDIDNGQTLCLKCHKLEPNHDKWLMKKEN